MKLKTPTDSEDEGGDEMKTSQQEQKNKSVKHDRHWDSDWNEHRSLSLFFRRKQLRLNDITPETFIISSPQPNIHLF